MSSKAAARPLLVWGSNTDVGKTLCSASLVRAGLRMHAQSAEARVSYVKALQTGVSSMEDPNADANAIVRHLSWFGSPSPSSLDRTTLFHWPEPVSPHVACRMHGDEPPSDEQVVRAVEEAFAKSTVEGRSHLAFGILESSGGVMSPGADFAVQADVFAPLEYPAFVVGDGRLGGIHATLTSIESLLKRNYEIKAVAVLTSDDSEHKLGNTAYISDWMKTVSELKNAACIKLPPIPPAQAPLNEWLEVSDPVLQDWLAAANL